MEIEKYGYDHAASTRDYLCKRLEEGGVKPENLKDGIILGSGLGNFVKDYFRQEGSLEISFAELLNEMKLSSGEETVPGHAKKLVIGQLKGDSSDRLVMAQAGREHPYEGVDIKRSVFWFRVMQLLGFETLLGSNAVGIATPKTFPLPSLMLAHSHQDLVSMNPLIGPNEPNLGPRFPHMGDLYPEKTRNLVKKVAEKLGIPLVEGTLVQTKGPNYESSETVYRIRAMLNGMYEEGRKQPGENRFNGEPIGGAGMSSTYEHMVAQHASPIQGEHPNRAFGKGRAHISVGTNYAAGLGPEGFVAPPEHKEVEENSRKVQDYFGRLVREVIFAMREAS